jgi:hypothetical protein
MEEFGFRNNGSVNPDVPTMDLSNHTLAFKGIRNEQWPKCLEMDGPDLLILYCV